MFTIIKDFLNYRNAIKTAEGKQLHINVQANTSASMPRHVGRILRILQTLQKPNLDKIVRDALEDEFNQRKTQLALLGTVLPDNMEGIENLYNDLVLGSNG